MPSKTYTVILSGPKSAEAQVRTALAGAGYTVDPDDYNHGLPDSVSGKKVRQAIAFVTTEAEDINGPPAVVASLGYVLRMHYEKPPPRPLVVDAIADLQARIAVLEAR